MSNGSKFLGKPYEPNAIIKNDIEFILMQRKPGGFGNAQLQIELKPHTAVEGVGALQETAPAYKKPGYARKRLAIGRSGTYAKAQLLICAGDDGAYRVWFAAG